MKVAKHTEDGGHDGIDDVGDDHVYLFSDKVNRPVFSISMDDDGVLEIRAVYLSGVVIAPQSGNVVRVRAVSATRERFP